MLRLSKLADYGVELMIRLSLSEDGKGTAVDMSKASDLSRPTVTKILKSLSQAGLLKSSRGRSGGYELSKKPSEISLLDIAKAIDGPLALADCAGCDTPCIRQSFCQAKAGLVKVSQALSEVLGRSMLDDLARVSREAGHCKASCKDCPGSDKGGKKAKTETKAKGKAAGKKADVKGE